ncbi:putative MFS general substrate transporter [Rosellinia necatrix]|uniref:Putative MFS general substrate transporter n=1 Tax=Rosellinia necatrix TaxID=77044 RepID=A0A1W2TJP4_ROSNE|nr:putative MFS general substrate transporter [Rosellinia necatrix]
MAGDDETTPLLRERECDEAPNAKLKRWFSPATLILCGGFLISLSFSYTQTPLLYTFHVMVCEEFYKHAPPYEGTGDRCARNEVDAGAASQVAIMGAATVICGITNLFVAGWEMRKYGPKKALAIQTFFPAIRVSIQASSLFIGARTGIIIMQLSQLMGVWGGPAGYILILNTIVAEITEPAGRTAMFGKLQGVLMLGVSLGFIVGGILAEKFGIATPFEVAAVSFLTCTAYVLSFVPYIDPKNLSSDNKAPKGKGFLGFLSPLKVLGPQKMMLVDGRTKKHFGISFLALGIFTGVLATGYAPTLIQMYSMSAFEFTSTNNSLLMSINCLVRGLFLMFVFPHIISYGRLAFKRDDAPWLGASPDSPLPTEPYDIDPLPAIVADQEEPTRPPKVVTVTQGAGFDLFFLRWSLLIDGIITASSAFATQGWHMYLVGSLLPLASGSAPAAKGVLTEMVPANRKADALQAMTLVEHSATLMTMGLFGFIFSSFANMGQSYLTFYCNAAVAIVGVLVLLLSRFPPPDSEMIVDGVETEPLLSDSEG